MSDPARERRLHAQRASHRILSGDRPRTMREHVAALETGGDLDELPDYYGDRCVTALEHRVAELLGTEDAVFFPTGTMAQQVALRYGADVTGNPTVALHPLGHQEVHEGHAYANLSGLRSTWPTQEPRNPTAEEIAALPEPVSSVVIELPLRDAGFVLPTWDDLVSVCAAAHDRGARVHFDGARLWDSAPYLAHTYGEIAALADSTYVSFYKVLGGISGAALAGTSGLASYARAWRQRYGGLLFQQWPAVLTATRALTYVLPRIPEYVTHARSVADALRQLPGARVHPNPPHTCEFRFWLPYPAEALNDAALTLAEEEKVWFAGGWEDAGVPGTAVTEIRVAAPALDWTAADITAAAARFLSRVTAET